jgi:hypothetical protein
MLSSGLFAAAGGTVMATAVKLAWPRAELEYLAELREQFLLLSKRHDDADSGRHACSRHGPPGLREPWIRDRGNACRPSRSGNGPTGVHRWGCHLQCDVSESHAFDRATLEWLVSIGADELSDNQRVGLALVRNGQSLSNEVYRKFNNIDSRVATRELRELVRRGLIRSVSSGRWTTYRAADAAEVPRQPDLPIEVTPPARVRAQDRPNVATDILQLLGKGEELSSSEIAGALGVPSSTIGSDSFGIRGVSSLGSSTSEVRI